MQLGLGIGVAAAALGFAGALLAYRRRTRRRQAATARRRPRGGSGLAASMAGAAADARRGTVLFHSPLLQLRELPSNAGTAPQHGALAAASAAAGTDAAAPPASNGSGGDADVERITAASTSREAVKKEFHRVQATGTTDSAQTAALLGAAGSANGVALAHLRKVSRRGGGSRANVLRSKRLNLKVTKV